MNGHRPWKTLLDELIREAIALHLEELRRHGDPVPPPQTTAAEVDVAA